MEHLSRLPFPPFLYRAALSGTNFLSPSLGADGGSGDSRGKWKTERGGGCGGAKQRPNHRPSVRPSRGEGPRCITCFLPRDQRGQSCCGEGRKAPRDNSDPVVGFGGRQRIFTAQILPPSGADKALVGWLVGGSWEVLHPTLLLRAQSGLAKGFGLSGNGGIFSPGEACGGRPEPRTKPSAAMGRPALSSHVGSGDVPIAGRGGSSAFSKLPLAVTRRTR